MHLFIWISTALLLGLWTLAGWGLYQLLGLDPAWLGELKPLLDDLPYAAVIDQWLPGWREGLRLLIDLGQTALAWIGSAAPWVIAVVWGGGALLLLGGAALLSLIVALVRRNAAPAPPPPSPPMQPAA
jgi:hypothetical protein